MIRKPTHGQIRNIMETVEGWRGEVAAEGLAFANPDPYEATLFLLTEVGEAVDALIRSYSGTAYTRASGNPKRAHLYDELLDVAFMAASVVGERRPTSGQMTCALNAAFRAHPLPGGIRATAGARRLYEEMRIQEHELRYLVSTRLTAFAAQACAEAEGLQVLDREMPLKYEAAIRVGAVTERLVFLVTCVIVVAYAAAALHLGQTVRLDSYESARPEWFAEDLRYRLDERREKVIRRVGKIGGEKRDG
mgnify:CR=1 FL=1